MKHVKYMTLVSALAVLSSLSAFARDKNQHSVNIPDAVQVGSTQLQPGNYKVEWQGNGPGVQVSFLQHGKTVATVPGTLKTNEGPAIQDDVQIDATSSSSRTLEKIDFGREALVFQQSGM
jgi:hypothetical protein